MRLSGSKPRLRVLIAFLLGSLFLITGCAGVGTGTQESDTLHPEFYAAKKLDNADIVKLRQLMSSANPYISSAATLLLGNYYFKFGDKSYGKLLINKSWNAKEYGSQMQLFGKLWKLDLYLSDKDIAGAKKMVSEIKSAPQDDIYIRTLKIYCTTAGYPAGDIVALTACIDKRIIDNQGGAGADSNSTESAAPKSDMTYEEFLKMMGDGGEKLDVTESVAGGFEVMPDSTINIVGGDLYDEEQMGMMYAISKLGVSFKMNSISENAAEEMDNEIIVRLGNMQVTTGEANAALGVDWNELIDTAGRMVYASRFGVVMIAASEAKMPLARLLQVLYRERGIDSVVFSYNSPQFQANLRATMTKYQEKYILLTGIGTEEELQTFAGVAKFLQTKPDREKILLITSSIGDIKLRPEFSAYYKEVLILTPIQTVDDIRFQTVSSDFWTFFGNQMNARNMQGYDAIVYLRNMTESEEKEKFISNITDIISGKSVRPIGLFTFNKLLEFKELQLDLVELPPAEDIVDETKETQTEVMQ